MNRFTTTTLPLALLLVSGALSAAEPPEAPPQPAVAPAPETPRAVEELHFAHEARAAEAYEQALKEAEKSQREALQAVEAARAQIEKQAVAAEKARLERERTAGDAAAARAELERAREEARESRRAVERELERAHENLRRASREVARVHREMNRPLPPAAPAPPGGYAVRVAGAERPVVGVVLGGSVENGVPVLGVSPDGPAERAGIQQGDVIISIMGKELAGGGADPRKLLSESLEGIEVGDELNIGVLRDGTNREFTVTVAAREPFTWHGLSRLATAPEADESRILIERITVPEIDREQLDAELGRLREQLEVIRVAPGVRAYSFSDGETTQDFTFEFEEVSDLGDTVIAGTNVWFGMPLTRGIKMTELDQDLGGYFGAERGVLVLRAEADNGMQLRSGDVILRVGGTEVQTPGDVMRALRDVDSGSQVEIDIKRERRNRTLTVDVPEHRVGLLAPPHPEAPVVAPTPPAPDSP